MEKRELEEAQRERERFDRRLAEIDDELDRGEETSSSSRTDERRSPRRLRRSRRG